MEPTPEIVAKGRDEKRQAIGRHTLSIVAIQNVECVFFDSNMLSFVYGDPEDPIRLMWKNSFLYCKSTSRSRSSGTELAIFKMKLIAIVFPQPGVELSPKFPLGLRLTGQTT